MKWKEEECGHVDDATCVDKTRRDEYASRCLLSSGGTQAPRLLVVSHLFIIKLLYYTSFIILPAGQFPVTHSGWVFLIYLFMNRAIE